MKRADFKGPPKTPEEAHFRDAVRRLLRVPKREIEEPEKPREKRTPDPSPRSKDD